MPSIKQIVERELEANPMLGTTSLVERVRMTDPSANYSTVTRHRRAWKARNKRSSVTNTKTWELFDKVLTPEGWPGTVIAAEKNGLGEQLVAVKVKSSIKYYKAQQLSNLIQ